MKQCPKCSRLYDDDSLRFCLDDGASLVRKVSLERPTVHAGAPRTHNEKATEVLPGSRLAKPTQTQPLIPWVVAGVALLLVAVMLILTIANYRSGKPSANSNGSSFDRRNTNSTPQDSPKVTQLAGTTWTQSSSVSQMSEFNFLPNGTINNHSEDTWQQTGNTLVMEITNGYARYEGTIVGDRIDYKAHNKVNFDWTGTLHRIK